MQRSLQLQQKQMRLLQKLLNQNRRQLLLPQSRSLKLLRQIFLQHQNQKSLLPLQRENGKARVVLNPRESVPKVRAREAGKVSPAVAGKVSLVASNLRESVPKDRAREAGKASPAVAGRVSLVASSLRENGPKVMVREAGKVSPAVSSHGVNGRARAQVLSHVRRDRAVSDRVRKVRVVVSDQGVKATRCHRK